MSKLGSAELLSANGPFAQQWSRFLPRIGQQQMAEAIQLLIESDVTNDTVVNQPLVLEAPSGSGKTLAYLVPIIQYGRRVIISTASRYLQNQLCRHDIPLVAKILQKSPRVALLQGRKNYLCPYYLEQHLKTSKLGVLPALARIKQFYHTTGYGELSKYESLLTPQIHPLVSCDNDDCLGQRCPQFDRCPLMLARAKAQCADILVINHSILFSDKVMRRESLGDLLPEVDLVLVDEAHRLADFADTILGQQVSSKKIKAFCKQAQDVLVEFCPEQRSLLKFISQVTAVADQLGGKLPSLVDYEAFRHRAVVMHWVGVFDRMASSLQQLEQRDQILLELSIKSQHLLACLTAIASSEGLCWVQARTNGFLMQSIPLHLSALLQDLQQESNARWAFTSATLSVADDPSRFLSSLGLPPASFNRMSSEIDHQQQAILYLPPLPVEPEHAEFIECFASHLLSLIEQVDGRVLVLFSSYQYLEQTASLLASKTSRTLLIQKTSANKRGVAAAGGDNFQLIQQFKACNNGVLLGTGSFWEGLDLSGVPLSAVVIDKLPFAPPDSPLIQLRAAELAAHGVDSFEHYMLPAAVIRLRQGCGRLLRRPSDRGVIMIADKRLLSKPYGRVFLASLPVMAQVTSLPLVTDFLARKKTDAVS
ncbi:ATP-dependent DNA helicase [Oceanicoccus sp. KOV_DT_Chl]|uniref:ATP-dependent DNA helicase n=1 Tax=Oceanicoccus sp. KOV_DT_Chl TaxID=1904639 RepID=UPI000C7B0709|nr:ATP-dependent DNA helicase [Oceanicoccus sp. KOV_DT_Chl]